MKKDLVRDIVRRLSPFRMFMWNLIFLILKELKSPVKVPFFKTLWLWRNGFLRKSFILFSLQKSNIKEYVSDYSAYVKAPLINGEYAFVLNNKVMFSKALHKYKEYLPTNYCLIKDGGVLPVNDDFFPLHKVDDIISLCNEMECLVIKPTSGLFGQDVYIFRIMNGKLLFNRSEVTLAEAKQFLSGLDDYLVCEYVLQHKYAARIFPDAANTLRILTMWDYDQNSPFVAIAIHRFGTTLSIPVDNTSQGGLYCSIDLNTGKVGKGLSFSNDPVVSLLWHEKHPDTNAQIEGVSIPRWDATTTKLCEIANHIPFIPYIGWDLVITEEGFKVIEGNNCPAVLPQVFSPLLKDPRVRKFYRRFKVV